MKKLLILLTVSMAMANTASAQWFMEQLDFTNEEFVGVDKDANKVEATYFAGKDNPNAKGEFTPLIASADFAFMGEGKYHKNEADPSKSGWEFTKDSYFLISRLGAGCHFRFVLLSEDEDNKEKFVFCKGRDAKTTIVNAVDNQPVVIGDSLVDDQFVIYYGGETVLKFAKGQVLQRIEAGGFTQVGSLDDVSSPTVEYNEADYSVTITPGESSWERAEISTYYNISYLSVPGEEQKEAVRVIGSEPFTVNLEHEGKISVSAYCVSSFWGESGQGGKVIDNLTYTQDIDLTDEWQTYVCNKNIDLTDTNLNAYIITAKQTSSAQGTVKMADSGMELQQVKVVPARTPVVLYGEKGSYTVNAKPDKLDDVSGNLLEESTRYVRLDATTAPAYYLFSKNKDQGYGFYQATSGTEISSGVIFLHLTDEVLQQKAGQGFDLELTSGIRQQVTVAQPSTEVYTLSGFRVVTPLKSGIYIVDGKKVVVK